MLSFYNDIFFATMFPIDLIVFFYNLKASLIDKCVQEELIFGHIILLPYQFEKNEFGINLLFYFIIRSPYTLLRNLFSRLLVRLLLPCFTHKHIYIYRIYINGFDFEDLHYINRKYCVIKKHILFFLQPYFLNKQKKLLNYFSKAFLEINI